MKGRTAFQKIAAVPHVVWTVMFIVAPMLFVLYFALTDGVCLADTVYSAVTYEESFTCEAYGLAVYFYSRADT